MLLENFYNNDFVNYASYDNLRKIASCIDGQKNSSRKVCCCLLDKKIKEPVKVSQLGSKICEYTDYLHGSIDGVVVTLGQDFAGTNNMPLVKKRGNFGTRFSPEASASRYIFACGSEDLFKIFRQEDCDILIKQTFEGFAIEPKFYLPALPIILINGSEGISSGFAQKILPRSPEIIREYMMKRLAGETIDHNFEDKAFTPSFNGFCGTVTKASEPNQWQINGKFERIGKNTVKITELPVGYSLKSYLAVLNKLEDDKKITGFIDKSDNDRFLFEVSFAPRVLTQMQDVEVYELLKLSKLVTENFTCLDENNKIIVFNSAKELFDYYFDVKLDYLGKRKESLLNKYSNDLLIMHSKALFIEFVQSGAVVVANKKKAEVQKQLQQIPEIIEGDNYEYLLKMPLYSLTVEKIKELKNQVKELATKIKSLKNKTVQALWLDDIMG